MMDYDTMFVRLWDHVLVQAYGTSDLISRKQLPENPQAHAFFLAIDSAFTTNWAWRKDHVHVDPELVQYMACWGREMTNGNEQRGGAVQPTPNHFIRRGFKGFIQTLRNAIKRGHIAYCEDGRVLYGCFTLPQWFVDHCMNEAWDEALHINQQFDQHPRFRELVLRDPKFLD